MIGRGRVYQMVLLLLIGRKHPRLVMEYPVGIMGMGMINTVSHDCRGGRGNGNVTDHGNVIDVGNVSYGGNLIVIQCINVKMIQMPVVVQMISGSVTRTYDHGVNHPR